MTERETQLARIRDAYERSHPVTLVALRFGNLLCSLEYSGAEGAPAGQPVWECTEHGGVYVSGLSWSLS